MHYLTFVLQVNKDIETHVLHMNNNDINYLSNYVRKDELLTS